MPQTVCSTSGKQRDERRREERERVAVLGDVGLPRGAPLERGEVVPEVTHRPDAERHDREERARGARGESWSRPGEPWVAAADIFTLALGEGDVV